MSWPCLLRGPGSSDTPSRHIAPRSWFLNPIPHFPGAGKYQMSLEYHGTTKKGSTNKRGAGELGEPCLKYTGTNLKEVCNGL